MAKRKSLLDRIGDALKGKNQQDLAGTAKDATEEAQRAVEQKAEQARDVAARQAAQAKAQAEAKAARLQRELKEREEALARAESERKKEEIRAQIRRQQEAVEARKAEVAAAAEPRIYVVQSGDSLSKIAKALYGDANRWPDIFEANKDQIKDPNLIYPDQKLRIP